MWQNFQGTAMELLGVIHELSNKSDKKNCIAIQLSDYSKTVQCT